MALFITKRLLMALATVLVVAVNLVLELATKFLDPKLRAS